MTSYFMYLKLCY